MNDKGVCRTAPSTPGLLITSYVSKTGGGLGEWGGRVKANFEKCPKGSSFFSGNLPLAGRGSVAVAVTGCDR